MAVWFDPLPPSAALPLKGRAVQIILAPLPGCVVKDIQEPRVSLRFAQPGAIRLPALRAAFARRRRARRLARGERAKRATPGTSHTKNRTPKGVRGLPTTSLLNFTTSAARNLDSSAPNGEGGASGAANFCQPWTARSTRTTSPHR